MNVVVHNPKDLRKASLHLHYEVEMLAALILLRNAGIMSWPPVRNALVESFAIHSRNLIEFLYARRPRPTDVVAENFFPHPNDWYNVRPKKNKSFDKAIDRADKEIAHLTYNRLQVKTAQKAWVWDPIYYGIMTTLKVFLTHVPPSNLHRVWRKHRKVK